VEEKFVPNDHDRLEGAKKQRGLAIIGQSITGPRTVGGKIDLTIRQESRAKLC